MSFQEVEDDGGVRKRKRDGEAGAAVAGKVEEDEEEYEGIAEESVAEVMRWLEMEISLSAAASPAADAMAAASTPAAGSAVVTINGNEESCGPSFSDSASTVMASVDTRAGAPPPPAVPWPWPEAAATGPAAEEGGPEAVDDEWVVQVLAGGPALEGQ